MLSEISLLGTKEGTLPRRKILFQEGSHPLLTRIFEKTLVATLPRLMGGIE